jgi:hypothetical protein
MLIDVQRFVDAENPYWEELELMLTRVEANPDRGSIWAKQNV